MDIKCIKIDPPVPLHSPNFSNKARKIKLISTPPLQLDKVCTGKAKIVTNKTKILIKVQQESPILSPI